MDQVRNFAQSNRSSIVNIIYIIAAVVLVYYLVMYYFNTEQKDIVLLRNKTATGVAKNMDPLIIVEGSENTYRLRTEYTVSFWIYISDYNNSTDQAMGILNIIDTGKWSTTEGDVSQTVLFVGLHPTRPQMIIRPGFPGTGNAGDSLVSWTAGGNGNPRWNAENESFISSDSLTPCDVMDIDLQRWMNIVVSVNGRILDVYMDGKLARSCIMDNIQSLSTDQTQVMQLFPTSSFFNGYISGIQVSNYALTPDVIYGRYQAGPYFSTGFLDYLIDKLGIRISYQGTGDATTTDVGIASFFK